MASLARRFSDCLFFYKTPLRPCVILETVVGCASTREGLAATAAAGKYVNRGMEQPGSSSGS